MASPWMWWPRDRISGLPDSVLGHVLSFLPTPEAGRAAALSRRWRYIFGHVHTVTYEEKDGERSFDWDSFYFEAKEYKSCSSTLLDGISAALLCRRRYVLEYARVELHLDLRFILGHTCARDGYRRDVYDKYGDETDSDSDDDAWFYPLPGRLFSCAALKTLCLGHCRLRLPANVNLPCLETLRLTGILVDSGRSIQRLILSCPRLVDLTLEAVRHVRTLFLHGRLHRFALRCCHNAKSVHINASELVFLEYRGAVPAESLLTLHGSPPQQFSCTVDFCTPVSKNAAEHAAAKRFMWSFSASKRLHLHHGRLHSSSLAGDGLPLFPRMTRLELQGHIESLGFVGAVRNILEQTPNLEVLTLYMAEKMAQRQQASAPKDDDGHAAVVVVPDEESFSTPCLRLRVKEINLVHYQGNEVQRTLARLLFSNAIVLEKLCVVFTKERFAVQTGLKNEIEALARAGSKRIFR
ncbi:unnamed protein product [Alopecurus aequalis]